MFLAQQTPQAYIQLAEIQPSANYDLVDKIAAVDFKEAAMPANNARVSEYGTNPMEFHSHKFRNLNVAGVSYVQMETNLAVDQSKTYYLTLDHCSTIVNDQPLSKVTISVNGKIVLSGHNPMSGGGFVRQQVEITPYLQNGANTVRVSLDANSIARYWLKDLSIVSLPTKH